jgi:DNA-binding transcriptional MerR regulator
MQPFRVLFMASSPQKPVHANSDYLTIGALASLCDVTVRALRYYEEMDLIGPAMRSSGKYRLYNQRSVQRIRAILALLELNFSLDEILAVLGPYSTSQAFTKEEQVAHTRDSLLRRQNLIREKMSRMSLISDELDERLKRLDSACVPCMAEHPELPYCQNDCSELTVHE